MTDERTVELCFFSAEHLKKVNWSGKLRPYVVAWISPDHKVSTSTCQEGGINPKWNERVELRVSERYLQQPKAAICIGIYHDGALGPKSIGSVEIPFKEVTKYGKSGIPQHMAYQIRRKSGKTRGVIYLSVSLGEKLGEVVRPAVQTSPPQRVTGYDTVRLSIDVPAYPPSPAGFPQVYPPPRSSPSEFPATAAYPQGFSPPAENYATSGYAQAYYPPPSYPHTFFPASYPREYTTPVQPYPPGYTQYAYTSPHGSYPQTPPPPPFYAYPP